ncbi:MAG TPA: zf-HC2 domain-containing protein [Propionibacteriaceae bacterium]
MNAILDKFAQWDAAYVLGALSPAERREFEEHLASCPSCQAAVSELAALPGLLAQLPPDDAAMLSVADEKVAESAEAPALSGVQTDVIEQGLPPSLLPKMMKKVRTRRRRMVAAVAGIAAAVLLVIGGLAVGAGLLPLGPDGLQRVAFSQVVPSAMIAVADVIPGQNGTEIKVECSYGEVNEPTPGAGHETYSIFVVDRAGNASEIKEWPATPNKLMRPSGTTPLRVSEIADLEIRETDTDEVMLRAPLR